MTRGIKYKYIVVAENEKGAKMQTKKADYLLTIAIPTYNRKDLLKRALDSIEPQLNSKIEVLVSDNASDDGTDEMMVTHFPSIRFIKNEKNMGADYNFLQCYQEARGKYVILFGSDDRLAVGALAYIVDFLEKNDCDLTFINYRFFDVTKGEEYINDSEAIKNYKTKHDIVTKDRNLFLKYAGITYMSALVVKRLPLLEVKNPERFMGTNFIHTYIILESIKDNQPLFGLVMQPLVEANATAGQSEVSKTPERQYEVFGKCMYHVICVHAVECGFTKRQTRRYYLRYLHHNLFWKSFLSFKRRGIDKAVENFWQDGYPVVKHFPSEWGKVMLVAITPHFVINAVHKIYKMFKKGE